MRSFLCAAVTIGALVPSPCLAAPLEVGPGRAYATPCAAVAAAQADDVIEIQPGTYNDSCTIDVAGLTLRGVGGQPKIDLSGTDHPAQYKGIYVIDADDITVENLELTGAHISAAQGGNAAALRVQAAGLNVRGCSIHDNQNGILGGTSGTLTIEHSELRSNGVGDGCNQGGCTHNLYVDHIDALYFRFNWSHSIATDTRDKGHLLKSRAKANYILYNRLSGEDGFDSYEIDLPNGGLAVVVGNVIQKGPQSGNGTLLTWGEEGVTNVDTRVFITSNTFVNDAASGRFLSVATAMLVAHNNLFVGPGTLSSTGALSADNLRVDPLFVDRVLYDYHLQSGSPAIGKAVEPGRVDSLSLVSLVPEYEYVEPLGQAERPRHADVGAFESVGTDAAGAGQSGGPSASVAGRGAAGAAGTSAAAGHASDANQVESEAGCSCRTVALPRRSRGQPATFALLLSAMSMRTLRAMCTMRAARTRRRRARADAARCRS